MSETSVYKSWKYMKARCNNPNDSAYKNYGDRGISHCKRWKKFESFFKDMGKRPKNKSLDRINNDGNYSKKNCRWATKKQQQRNRRGNSNSTSKYKGVYKHVKKWVAVIREDRINYHIGCFEKEIDAAKAYNKEAKRRWGKDAYLNKVSK